MCFYIHSIFLNLVCHMLYNWVGIVHNIMFGVTLCKLIYPDHVFHKVH